MGFYDDRILPHLLNFCANSLEIEKTRKEVIKHASGIVLEIGMGSGLNLKHYPHSVTRLLAVEPSQVARSIAAKRIQDLPFPFEWVGLDGQKLSLADQSVDCVVSTLTLCTIPSPECALQEIARILKPGGQFLFLEHGVSPDEGIARWQDRLNGIQQKIMGGCHLNRSIQDLLLKSQLSLESLEKSYVKGMPRFVGYWYRGIAKKPDSIV